MTAFQFRMPAGIPGEITRSGLSVVEPNVIDANTPPTAFGVFVKLATGKIQPCAVAGDVAAGVVYGLIVRPYPTQQNSTSPAFGGGTPSLTDSCSILRAGYMNVKLARGTAVKGGGVAMRTTAGSHAVGDIEDLTNVGAGDTDCTLVAGATFMGSADANGNVEIAFNI
jgi:hypothetical protein